MITGETGTPKYDYVDKQERRSCLCEAERHSRCNDNAGDIHCRGHM
jgi:hypothetical protein